MKDPPQLTDPSPVAADASKCDPHHLPTMKDQLSQNQVGILNQVRELMQHFVEDSPIDEGQDLKMNATTPAKAAIASSAAKAAAATGGGVVIMAEISMELISSVSCSSRRK